MSEHFNKSGRVYGKNVARSDYMTFFGILVSGSLYSVFLPIR